MIPSRRLSLLIWAASLALTTAWSTDRSEAGVTPSALVASFSAVDHGFEGPETLPAGLTIIRLHNRGQEPHQLQVLKLSEGRTAAELHVTRSTAEQPQFLGNVHMAMFDYEFVVVQNVRSGPQTFYVVNRGHHTHQVSLVQLNPGASAADMLAAFSPAAMAPLPGKLLGGMAGLEPGGRGLFTAWLSPGRYAMMCLFPDPAAHDSHAAKGMVMHFTVE